MRMIRILIAGKNSYIGTSFERYTEKFPEIETKTASLRQEAWKTLDFSAYDTVFHVAGIAHSDEGKISEERKKEYYAVNRDLAIAVAKKAKADGVKQFIYMSSSIVYGAAAPIGKEKIVTADTPLQPENCYGDSKVQAEKGLLPLEDENFKVAILRPPMIYGKNSKGNYPLLAKLAKKLPVFPDIRNARSMLYIENLCELVRLLAVNRDSGIFFPQNSEYFSTTELVRFIARAHGREIRVTKLLNPLVRFAGLFTRKGNKAFGSFCYERELSVYKQEYRLVGKEESVERTER